MNAAAFWFRALQEVGARVESQELPAGCKDLGALLAAGAVNQDEINQIFR